MRREGNGTEAIYDGADHWAEAIEFSISELTPSEVCLFPREPFEQILQDHPKMERLLCSGR